MTTVSVVAALAAALCYAATSVVQHVVVARVPEHPALSWAFLSALVRRPLWLASQALDGVAVILQALALRYGPVLLVQPLVALALVFAVPLRDVIGRRRPRSGPLATAALACAGIAVLVVVLQPTETGRLRGAWVAGTAYAVGLAVAVGAATTAHRMRHGTGRAAVLAVVGGTLVGAAVVAMKPVVSDLPRFGAVATSWPVYAMVPCALAGMMLSQSALQTGPLALPLTLLTLVEPLVAAAGGIFLLGEQFAAGPVRSAVALAALVVTGGAIARLARQHAAEARPAPTEPEVRSRGA